MRQQQSIHENRKRVSSLVHLLFQGGIREDQKARVFQTEGGVDRVDVIRRKQ